MGVSQIHGSQGLLVWRPRPTCKTPPSSLWRGIFRKQLLAMSGFSLPSKGVPLWSPQLTLHEAQQDLSPDSKHNTYPALLS